MKRIKTTPAFSKEIFYVLKEDKEIKHGEYVRYGYTRKVAERGSYDLNQKVGIWEFYDRDGALEQRYNYDSNVLVFNPHKLSNKVRTQINGKYEAIIPDELPIFIGGVSKLAYLRMVRDYPLEARRAGIEGEIYISAVITTDGKLIDEKIEQTLGYGLDEEALKSIRNIPDDFIPAKHDEQDANVMILFPVFFRLD
ncbi:MAG: energy transducer TonB [Marinoscillum sp.]